MNIKSKGKPFLITLISLVIVVAGFLEFFIWASNAISAANSATSTLSAQMQTWQTQAASATSQLSATREQLSSVASQLASTQGQIATARFQESSLQNEIASYKAQVSTLQADLAASKSRVSALQSEIAAYKSQIASLQERLSSVASANVAALQEQVSAQQEIITRLRQESSDLTDIVKLNKVSVKADLAAVNQTESRRYSLGSFTADYAGYIVVAGQSSTSDAYVTLESSFPGYPLNEYRYPFGTGATLIIPVLPGSVALYYGNSNPNAASTATISVRYHY